MERAIELGRYCVVHAKVAFKLMGEDPRVEAARVVLTWIKKWAAPTWSERECFNALRAGFPTVEDLRPALTLLVTHGYIRLAPAPPHSGPGRKPSPVYQVNPHTLGSNPHNPQNGSAGDSDDAIERRALQEEGA
jgi:hypothetical protein